MKRSTLPIVICLLFCSGSALPGQTASPASKPDRDELIFTDGERLLGHLERSDGTSLTFKSDMAGEITVDWSKIKELHSSGRFAVVPKDVKFGRRRDGNKVPQGNIAIEQQQIQITGTGGESQTLTAAQTGYVVDQPTFAKSLRRPGLFEAWKGSATAGVSLVLATQNNRSYTSAITLSRAIPTEPWLNPENRTTIEFTSSYGELTQPGQPLTKTSIYHADAERDEYFTPQLYSFAEAAFDHNFSQGLDLEQTIGGGLGWTVIKRANQQLDLKAELTYVNQTFQLSSQNQKLLGSVLSEGYDHKFKRGIILHESLSISPGISITKAYSATANIIFTIPITKHLSLTLNSLDTFLNDPSPGFRKNSFQYTTGMTYVLP